MTHLTGRFATCLPVLTFALVMGCNADVVDEDPEVAAIAEALELQDGGLTMTDELPMFGDTELFDAADIAPEDMVEDAFETDDAVMTMLQLPDAVVFHTAVLWGQLPPDPSVTTPRNWSGAISVNRGAIIVRRTIRFEGPTDNLLPRNDPRVVPFTSATLPHHDGLRFDVIDPTPESPEPLVVTYVDHNNKVFEVPMAVLVNGPESQVVDGLGNRVAGVALPQLVDLCQHGMLGGRWHKRAEGRGNFVGVVANPLGDPIGHMLGIYGVRQNGDKVFFGKYINANGQFRGIFAGRYGEGHFAGRWKHASGDVGGLGGEYRETIPGPETGGHYLGRWAETSCNLPIGGPQPEGQ